jgi:hypothetical protein
MNLALWIAAGLLAVVFLVSSSTKLLVPKQDLDGLLQRLGPAAQAAGNGPGTSAPVPSRPSEFLSSWARRA